MKSIHAKTTLKLYWEHVSRHPLLVLVALVTIPVTTFVNNFLPPLIAANILDKLARGAYEKGNVLASFGPQLFWYAAIMLFGVLTWRIVDFSTWPLEGRVTKSLAEKVHSHLLSLSADFHANHFTGSLVSQTNKLVGAYVRIADTTIYGTLPLLWGVFFTSILLYKRAPLFVILFNIVVVLFITSAVLLTNKSRKAGAHHATTESKQTGALADSITNILAIKSYSAKKHEDARFSRYTRNTQKSLYRVIRYFLLQITVFSMFTRIMQITALIAAAISIVNYGANVATVFLILNYSATIADQLFNFSNSSLRNYNRALGDASDMAKILTLEPKIKDPVSPETVAVGNGEVEFANVSFTHDGNKKALFNNFNLHIRPGEKIGLVGHSGSGKSTLTRLLLRFSDISDGSVKVDGQDVRSITQDDLHKKITYVPQEPLLFHRSLAENIAYGKPNASKKEIEQVARLANAHEFIKDLPDGYDTLVGERGVKLSGGQRQRIAIARAMIKDAPIVVLDEATSALDSESEVLIQEALWKLIDGRTTVVIAHRLSTVQKMDRIIVLSNGRIAEQGSHSELIQKKGIYADLWNHQSGGFIED